MGVIWTYYGHVLGVLNTCLSARGPPRLTARCWARLLGWEGHQSIDHMDPPTKATIPGAPESLLVLSLLLFSPCVPEGKMSPSQSGVMASAMKCA